MTEQVLRWRGTPIPELSDAELISALRQALAICAAFWREVALRGLIRSI